MDRREFVAAVGGVTLASAAGCIGSGGGGAPTEPEYDDFFQGVDTFDGFEDYTDEDRVTVKVGAGETGLRFVPTAITIAKRTVVVWEWTGEGGKHNVESVDSPAGDWENPRGPTAEAGHTWSREFKQGGTHLYQCWPHAGSGMKGGIFVDLEAERASAGGTDDGGDESADGQDEGPSERVETTENWLQDTPNFENIDDRTGEDSIDVTVGAGGNGLLFDPPAIRVEAGTELTWNWTGNGGEHSVQATQTPGEQWENPDGLVEGDDHTWSRDFTATGTHLYECAHHTGVGMRGVVLVE
jgi:halocyanin-like protein